MAADSGLLTILILESLALSAAFDTTFHNILLDSLHLHHQHTFGLV